MSDYLVEPPPEGWGDWKGLVEKSNVRLTKQQLKLGEILIGRSDIPDQRPQVVMVWDTCHVSTVGELLQRPFFRDAVPVHPMVLLALAAGIQGAVDDSDIFRHMQYEMAMSPFLLSDPTGANFIFLLKNDRECFRGEFKALSGGDYLPRCTHIWGHPPGREPTDHLMFRTRADEKYGPYYS